jgi:hypothetical protein
VLSCPAQKKTSPIISVGSELRAPLSNAIETGTSVGFSDKKTFGLQTQRKTAFAAIADWCDSAHFRLFAKHLSIFLFLFDLGSRLGPGRSPARRALLGG